MRAVLLSLVIIICNKSGDLFFQWSQVPLLVPQYSCSPQTSHSQAAGVIVTAKAEIGERSQASGAIVTAKGRNGASESAPRGVFEFGENQSACGT